MKLLMYIWRNVRRNKLRTSLTILSIGFSLALMTVLYGYVAMQDVWGQAAATRNRLVVMNIQGFSGKLPISYVDRVRAQEGVVAAVPYSWYGGNYKDEQMPFAQFGTDAAQAFDVFSEYSISPDQLEAWRKDRMGCVVDRRLAEKRNWKIGDKIPLQGTIYPFDLDLTLRGTYDAPQYTDSLWFHLEYLDEGLQKISEAVAGNSGTIFTRVASSDRMSPLAKEIDEKFASSPNPTRTQTEAAFAQMFTDMLGNIRAYIRNIGLAVVFSLSLVAANAMAMSMRERTTEIAVLKALGFTKLRVLGLVLGEACSVCLMGGALGVFFGCLFLQGLHQMSAQVFPIPVYDMLGIWIGGLLLTAFGIGLVSGLVPAIRAATLSVVDGLRRIV